MFSSFAMALSASLLVRARYLSRISWARLSVWPVTDTISGRAARLGKHGDGGAAYIVEVKTGNPGGFTGFRPLVRKVPLLKREPRFRGQHHGRLAGRRV
jgi:hypothetical protein